MGMFKFIKGLFADEPPKKAPRPKPGGERQKLIAEAMKVHRAKRRILDDLDDESRAKLVAMAIVSMMNSDKKKRD